MSTLDKDAKTILTSITKLEAPRPALDCKPKKGIGCGECKKCVEYEILQRKLAEEEAEAKRLADLEAAKPKPKYRVSVTKNDIVFVFDRWSYTVHEINPQSRYTYGYLLSGDGCTRKRAEVKARRAIKKHERKQIIHKPLQFEV